MPLDHKVAREQWARYIYSRDTGHRSFVAKANRCEDFFAGSQWDKAHVAKMAAVKRPTLTINTVLNTLSSIFGEQIDLATEINFKPRYNAPPRNADVLTKTYRFIGDENQLSWQREAVFADGCITSRGYFDVRLKFENNAAGEVSIGRLNPRMVLPDPDASDYDPDTWNDVITTSWMTPDDIELLYNKRDADALRVRGESVWQHHGYDSIDTGNDRFGGPLSAALELTEDMKASMRGIRVIDRQHRRLTKMRYFVDPKSGDRMQIPDQWDEATVQTAAKQGGLMITQEVGKRVRWTVTAEDFVLHDDWSPFKRFTVVPFFPHFRYGRTIGIVENLLDPQELLNKSLSQELHIVNSMANSGWKVKTGALTNMEIDELEERGAETGLIIEVNGNPETDVVKITPNQIPQGLDRLSFKAEQYVKLVSGRGNNQLGMTRPDQSGKLTEESNKAGDVSLRPVMRNLERTDYLLARNVVDLVQNFYTDRRLMHIVNDDLTGEVEPIEINLPDPATGEVLNDLTLGTYMIVVTSQKARRTLEEGEAAQAVEMRKNGIMIPDRFVVENSNLRKRAEIVKAMDEKEASAEAQLMRQTQVLTAQLEVANLKGEASRLEADALLKRAKASKEVAATAAEMQGEPGEAEKAQAEMAIAKQKHDLEMEQMREEHALKMKIKEEEAAQKREQAELDAAEKRRAMRIESMARAKAAAKAPAPAAGGAGAARPKAAAAPAA
jgi:hypothetical protein